MNDKAETFPFPYYDDATYKWFLRLRLRRDIMTNHLPINE